MQYGSLMMLVTALTCCLGCQGPLRTTSQPEFRPPAPRAGETAPVFTLQTLDREREVDLASFKGNRPVLLMFGSYT